MQKSIFLLPVIIACQSNQIETKEWFLNDNRIVWDIDKLVIETESGLTLFESPANQTPISWGQGTAEVSYGSGSFFFEGEEDNWCADATLAFKEGTEDEIHLTASSSKCDEKADVYFTIAGDGRLGIELKTSEENNRIKITGSSHSEERIFGFGAQADRINMKGKKLPIWCQEQGHGRGAEPISSILAAREGNPAGEWHNSYTCVPWMFTDSGWGLLLEDTERAIFDMRLDDQFEVSLWSNSMALQLIEGPLPADLITRATSVFGRMKSLPEWTQKGAIIRAHGGAEAVLEEVEEALSTGTPLAGIWIEDWCGLRETSLGSRMWWNWTVDRNLYPEWEALVEELDAMGLATLAYLNPYLTDASNHSGAEENLFAEAQNQGFLVKNYDDSIFLMDQGGFDAALVDLSNPEAVAWLTEIVSDVVQTGVKGWMADFAEGLPLDVSLKNGTPNSWHNKWPEKWAEINQNALSSEIDSDHLIFHRSGNQFSPGKARAFWVGDQTVTWDKNDGIASVIPLLLSSGLSGYSIQHSDTGGYLSVSLLDVTRDDELFQRWVELNAMTPLLRLHSTNQPEENHQWNTDIETITHFKRFAKLYKDLAPVRESLMIEATEKGWPLIRPLFFHYETDPEAWEIEDQFMLGPDLLMAPVVTKGALTRRLYLPDGQWIHGPSQSMYTGAQWIDIEAPIGTPPIFGRAESAAASALISLSLE